MTYKLGSEKVLASIMKLFDDANVNYKHIHHEPTPTSQDSARVRGEDISVGGKALYVKCDDTFYLFVVSAALKLDFKLVRKVVGCKKVRMATVEELDEHFDLVPGSVPPIGQPILDVKLYVDESIKNNEKIAFNAGMLTDSLIMTTKDYFSVVECEIVDISSL